EDTLLTGGEQADEALLMGLRLSEGVDLDRLARLAGVTLAPQAIDRLRARGLLEPGIGGRIRASRSGRLLLNAIVLELARAGRAAEWLRGLTWPGAAAPAGGLPAASAGGVSRIPAPILCPSSTASARSAVPSASRR